MEMTECDESWMFVREAEPGHSIVVIGGIQ